MNRLPSIAASCWLLAAMSIPAASGGPAFILTAGDIQGPNWGMITSGTLSDGTPFSIDTGALSPPVYGGESLTSSGYGAPLPAGFIGLAGCGVGDNDSLEYVSLALSGVDLGDYDSYSVVLSNDNDDPWQYRLFADDGGGTVLGPWTAISPNGTAQSLSIDISGLDGTGLVGFQIGSDLREDCFHTSVGPVLTPEGIIPAPGTLLLTGIGSLIVGGLRGRRRI